jgi:hypothetical protein
VLLLTAADGSTRSRGLRFQEALVPRLDLLILRHLGVLALLGRLRIGGRYRKAKRKSNDSDRA